MGGDEVGGEAVRLRLVVSDLFVGRWTTRVREATMFIADVVAGGWAYIKWWFVLFVVTFLNKRNI